MEYSIEVMISKERIEKKIKELAAQIERDHKGKELIFIGLLKGSVIFMCDLIKEIKLPIFIDFMSVSSYGSGTKTTGIVKILKDIDFDVKDKELFIVEDIIDSGLTLKYVKDFLFAKGAAKVHICTLLDKPQRRKVDIKSDYVGFEIPDEFVVGYGLDYAQKHRNLPYVGKVVLRMKNEL
ncbi:MAG: hypoxanthine phosphoribosyltransferase [Fusobacteriaceae bacterium]|jgi:hypoxanthine phosphoribosyltransferase|nr:hypoxanthine phosphoribosyltransferase [Fusobacteriaceae bacterium]